VEIQFAMILDGSGSVGSWSLIVNGLATAVNNSACIPHDGSVELTVIQFSDYARLEVGPVVITDGNVAEVVSNITNITQIGSTTCISCGFCLAADTLFGSPYFDPSLKQAINLVTDGAPNECSCYGDSCSYSWGSCTGTDPAESAQCGRNYTLTKLGMTSGQDELDAEFIGTQGPASDWLKDYIVWPEQADGNGYYAPPFDKGPGWVRVVADEQGFADTLCEKFQAIVPPPSVGGEAYPIGKLPMLAPWIALAVVLAGGIGWYTLRRRRAES
jgi:hypothetical protein